MEWLGSHFLVDKPV